MRDKLRDKQHFEQWIDKFYESISSILKCIETGKTTVERVPFMKRVAVGDYLNIIKCKYSAGYDTIDLKTDLEKAIRLTHESWIDDASKLHYRGKYLNQYTLDAYDQMAWMLSLGYLLDIQKTDFKRLVEVIDRDCIKDPLFEFIINAKMENRKILTTESYDDRWVLFGKIRQAIVEKDRRIAEKLVKEFIGKEWYSEHKDSGWYNGHRSKSNTYFGYWSFETAAIVKIMGLDDSGFRNCQYYPGDLLNHSF